MQVGVGTLGCSLRLGASLLAFFFSASQWSHWKEDAKASLDDSSRKGGQRDWKQVGGCGFWWWVVQPQAFPFRAGHLN